MNVIKFIEKFGWDDCSKENIWFHFGCSSERAFEEIYGFRVVEDLKRYVDAYELVQLHGSLRLANHYAMKNHCLSDSHTADDLWTVIALVEEVGDCNE